MPGSRRRRMPALLLLIAAAGCGAGWRAVPSLQPGALPPRQQVQVWQGASVLRLHGVVVGSDTIWGVPFLQPPECDSCRIGLPRGSVDSVRAGDPMAGFWGSTALVLALGVVAWCLAWECETPVD